MIESNKQYDIKQSSNQKDKLKWGPFIVGMLMAFLITLPTSNLTSSPDFLLLWLIIPQPLGFIIIGIVMGFWMGYLPKKN